MSTFYANHEKNLADRAWERANPMHGKRAYPRVGVEPLELQVDDYVRFYGLRTSGMRNTRVRAVTEHYALVTWQASSGGRNGPGIRDQYSVISWRDGWRGPHGSWGHGAITDDECRETLAALEAGEIEMSHRHSVHLDIAEVHRAGTTVFSDRSELDA